jgi:SAM-dependent methyltransferase
MEVCRICGSAGSNPWRKRSTWLYRSCPNCSAVWLDPMPPEGWAELYYQRGYFTGESPGGYHDYLADEALHRSNARGRIALARRFGAAPPAVWLDVGCAVGFTLDEARNVGFTVLGVELSAWARTIAFERYGLAVVSSLAEARQRIPGRVDIASLFQALEHLSDPLAALRDLRACLRPGGLLLIETWDRGSLVARLSGRYWQQITPPSVLWLLDRRSLAQVIERAGFRLEAIVRGSKRVSAGWVLGILALKAPRLFGPVLRMLGDSRVLRLEMSYGLGDLVSVVATAS